jgi:hypothetical protein
MCSEHQLMTWWPEDQYQECDLGYSSGHAPQNMARALISSGRPPCYQGSPNRGLLRSVKNFQSFTVICRKPHVAGSICLRAKIFQNPEGTLWTHCIFSLHYSAYFPPRVIPYVFAEIFNLFHKLILVDVLPIMYFNVKMQSLAEVSPQCNVHAWLH